jgi:hypothetical protein
VDLADAVAIAGEGAGDDGVLGRLFVGGAFVRGILFLELGGRGRREMA